MKIEFEIDEEFAETSEKIIDIINPLLEGISRSTYGDLLRPFICGVIHQLIIEGKIKLC